MDSTNLPVYFPLTPSIHHTSYGYHMSINIWSQLCHSRYIDRTGINTAMKIHLHPFRHIPNRIQIKSFEFVKWFRFITHSGIRYLIQYSIIIIIHCCFNVTIFVLVVYFAPSPNKVTFLWFVIFYWNVLMFDTIKL